jgi:hypothetical protein
MRVVIATADVSEVHSIKKTRHLFHPSVSFVSFLMNLKSMAEIIFCCQTYVNDGEKGDG